jgi:hypothetical protein
MYAVWDGEALKPVVAALAVVERTGWMRGNGTEGEKREWARRGSGGERWVVGAWL